MTSGARSPPVLLHFGDLTLDLADQRLHCGLRQWRLHRKAAGVLVVLMQAHGRVVPRARLLDVLWDDQPDGAGDGAVGVMVWRLRQRLVALQSKVTIENEFASGWRLVSPDGDGLVTLSLTPAEYAALRPHIEAARRG